MKQLKPYEILDKLMRRGEAIALSHVFGLTPQYIRAWCRRPETEKDHATGRKSFLERLKQTITFFYDEDGSHDRGRELVRWQAEMVDSLLIPRPTFEGNTDSELVKSLANMMKETGDAIEVLRVAWYEETPGHITPDQAVSACKELDDCLASAMIVREWIHVQITKQNNR